MIINTFSYLWSRSASEAIDELLRHGYRSFEVPISSPHCWPDELPQMERAALLRKLGEHGSRIRSLNAGGYDVNLASPGASVRKRSIEHIDSVIELATAFDVPEIVISPGTRRPIISPSLDRVHGWLYESLEDLIPRARKAGKRLLFENTPYCFTPTIDELVNVVQTVNDDSLRIVYDVANAAYIGEDTAAALEANEQWIALVHISDSGTDVWGHDPIGTGVIDWVALGRAVASTVGFENVVLEIIREENPLEEFAQALTDLRAAGWALPA